MSDQERRPDQPASPWAVPSVPQGVPGWPQSPPQRQQAPALPPHDQPQPYHRILRTRTFAWWRPLVGLAVFAGVFLILAIGILLAAMIVKVVASGGDFASISDDFLVEITPLGLLATNLGLAAGIPAAALAILAGHRLRPGWLGSVTGRLRWRLLGRFTAMAAAVVVVFSVLSGFLPGEPGEPGATELAPLREFVLFAIVILLTTPMQAAAEEFAFRGYGMQALGAYFRSPVVPLLVTSLLFAFAHGSQNLPLFIDRLGFGLVAAWLVLRTGGLEAAIALHMMNNMAAFLVAAAFGQITDSLQVTQAPWYLVAADIGQMLVFAWWADRTAKKRHVQAVTAAATASPTMPVWPRS